MTPLPQDAQRLAWRTPIEGALLIVRGRTFHPAGLIALIVGTLLTLVNLGAALIEREFGPATLARIGANYLIPYIVSSVGFLASYRVDGRLASPEEGTSQPETGSPRER